VTCCDKDYYCILHGASVKDVRMKEDGVRKNVDKNRHSAFRHLHCSM